MFVCRVGRRGFSLCEVLVAVVVIGVGILALTGTSGAVARMASQGGRLGGAALVAEGRVEFLRATSCSSPSGGSTVEGPYTLAWTVAASGALRTVRVSVAFNAGRSLRSDVYETVILCGT